MIKTNILIIGAGPAGLAIAGRLRHRGIPFEIIEKSRHPANAWRNHYERLHLHTVKELSHLPHLPLPEEYPLFVPRHQLADYFNAYTKHFDIQPHYGVEALIMDKNDERWMVQCTQGISFTASAVVIATGVNHHPNRPGFKGEEQFSGSILHSKAYRNPKPFLGQRVLVVGMGNTGAEIALDLSEHDIPTFLSVRSPVNIVPRTFLGNPTQKTAYTLAALPNWLGDWVGARVQRLAFGNLRKYGLKQSSMPPAKQLRELGKTPVIDVGTVAQIKAGKIKVVPGIKSFGKKEITFTDGSSQQIDTVILATGYRPFLDRLIPRAEKVLNEHGVPEHCIGKGFHQGLYFLGFDNYKPGGILGIIRTESEVIADELEKRALLHV